MNRNLLKLAFSVSLCFILASNTIARNGVNVSITSGPLFTDDINGLDHKVGHNSTYTYTVQIETDIKIQSAALGFILYSPDGSLTNIQWEAPPTNVGPWNSPITWNFGGPRLGSGPDNFDGSLPSTWITGGLNILADDAGYGPIGLTDALKFTIKLPSVDEGILCIDSAFFPVGGEWLMVSFDVEHISPEWKGGDGDIGVGGSRTSALCVTTFIIPPPELFFDSCPTNLSINHCETLQYLAHARGSDSGVITFTYSATTDGTGTVSVDGFGGVEYVPGPVESGNISIIVKATNNDPDGATGYCITEVAITNSVPELSCPLNIVVNKGDTAVSPTASVSDSDTCDTHTFSLVSVAPAPVGLVSVDPTSGSVTFATDIADVHGGLDTEYDITVSVTDGIDSAECTMTITVLPAEKFSITIDAKESEWVLPGDPIDVCLNYEAGSNLLSGFDFLIEYEPKLLTLISVTEGNIFSDYEWEYFTYRAGPSGTCCPTGTVRIVGLDRVQPYPNDNHFKQGDQFACLTFRATNDDRYSCELSPIRWKWIDCGDNSLAPPSGDTIYISDKVYDYIGSDFINISSGFRAELTGADQTFPTITGAPDTCDTISEKNRTTRYTDFNNGFVRIACLEAIDSRGDINLNGIANEIADAVVLSNYFVIGLSAFFDAEASRKTSDINNDGEFLTVGDLVYLSRVIIGDALPIPGDVPSDTLILADEAILSSRGGVFSTNADLGAITVIFSGEVDVTLLADGMELLVGVADGFTRVLVWSLNHNTIKAGNILSTDGVFSSAQAADTNGNHMNLRLDLVTDVEDDNASTLPRSFALYQNYPNPFNPSTTIRIDFPTTSDYSLKIYNISGQTVKKFTGTQSAGTLDIVWEPNSLPSGMYFYKIKAGDFVATKKLVLLK